MASINRASITGTAICNWSGFPSTITRLLVRKIPRFFFPSVQQEKWGGEGGGGGEDTSRIAKLLLKRFADFARSKIETGRANATRWNVAKNKRQSDERASRDENSLALSVHQASLPTSWTRDIVQTEMLQDAPPNRGKSSSKSLEWHASTNLVATSSVLVERQSTYRSCLV